MLIGYAVSIYLADFKTLPDFEEYCLSNFGNTTDMKLGRLEENMIFEEYVIHEPWPKGKKKKRSKKKKSKLYNDTRSCFSILAIKSSSGLRFTPFKQPSKEKKEIYLFLKEIRRIELIDTPY